MCVWLYCFYKLLRMHLDKTHTVVTVAKTSCVFRHIHTHERAINLPLKLKRFQLFAAKTGKNDRTTIILFKLS